MKKILPILICPVILFLTAIKATAQVVITPHNSVEELAQKLVGDGVSISNVTFTGISTMAGFFKQTGAGLGIDSGIVLTNGRAKSRPPFIGLNGDGANTAEDILADNSNGLPGDADLDNVIGGGTEDACVLEFDFFPLGDSIRFRYVFSSEEYTPQYVCTYNDAFSFFISGPGFPTMHNIALVPNTTTPVSIRNVNNIGTPGSPATCINNPSYFVNTLNSLFLTHDGMTKVLSAVAKVQPCQQYHLKLVIADVGDDQFDSGVFLEAKSLSSNAFQLTNLTQVDPATGQSYLVEGCATGALKIKRQDASNFSQTVFLGYGGTALNTLDVQTLPASITIPANETEVLLNIHPVMDLVPEGVEELIIYTLAPCAAGAPTPTDSAKIQIRDYDILGITPDTVNICRNSSVVLTASAGYTTYVWDANISLNSTSIASPRATPVSGATMYYCTANVGTCFARDSAFVRWKDIELLSKTEINCKSAATGQIVVSAGPEWVNPVTFAYNNSPFGGSGTFNSLTAGDYVIKVKDGAGCIDSISVPLTQLFPDLTATSTPVPATCSGNADGRITINVAGGKPAYQFSINNGASIQASNIFNVRQGNYQLLIKDNNGCTTSAIQQILLNNDLTIELGDDHTICEGSNILLETVSNGTAFSWNPSTALSQNTGATSVASPIVTTKYYVVATKGICTNRDSVIVNVNPAPHANAGNDITICYGASTQLNGSGGVQYSWSPANYLTNSNQSDTRVEKPLGDVTYYLKVKDANGCVSLKPDTVKLKVTPAVRMFAGRDTLVAFNQPLQLRATELSSSGVIHYTWSPSFGLNNPNIASPVARIDHDMTYVVTGRTAADCEGSDEIFIKAYKGPEIYVPTAFTPNNDGLNDLMRATAIGMKSYNFFTIYDRWGEVIFTTKDFNKGWDGKWKGVLQSTGTYVWIAETVDFRGNVVKRNGTTTLLR